MVGEGNRRNGEGEEWRVEREEVEWREDGREGAGERGREG